MSYQSDRVQQMSSGKHQTGSIWSKNRVDLRKKFTLEGYIYLGDQQQNSADGMTFSLQNYGQDYIGEDGQYLGMYHKNTGTNNWFLSYEFDTYYNGDGTDSDLPKGQHVSVTDIQNNKLHHFNPSMVPIYQGNPGTLSNGKWKKVKIQCIPKTNTYSELDFSFDDGSWFNSSDKEDVYFDGKGDSSGNHNFLNSPYAYWGFTSATGDKYEKNAVALTKVPDKASIKTKDIKIYKGQNWSPKDNFVSATDEYGNNIPFSNSSLTHSDNVNTKKVGTYQVTYTYKGEHQTINQSANVSVLEGLTLNANDISINQGDKFNPLDSRIGLKAYDQIDGDLTNKIEVIKNDVNSSMAGVYHVTYQVKNSLGEVAQKTIAVTIKPYNPWPNGDTEGWKMFSGKDIELKTDPENSILESNKVFYADQQASIYKIYSGKDALKAGKKYKVTVYFKPLTDTTPLSSYRVEVALKSDTSINHIGI